MKFKIIILGSKGMLGQMVLSYFSKTTSNVIEYNCKFDENSLLDYVNGLNNFEQSIIFNCIGRIKQKTNDPYSLFLSNTILPMELSRSLRPDHLLIHPSTDCVFNGTSGAPYSITDPHNGDDLYGISKSLGEQAIFSRKNSIIIRVSIIGMDRYTNKGLLSWFLSQTAGSTLNGYNNHFWNGITTFEWCKRVEHILLNYNHVDTPRIVQLGTKEIYSKFEMLKIFQNTFKTNVYIENVSDSININRCLKPSVYSSELDVQLKELKAFCVDWYN
jgi:dTDP-4-dehydrorhamnose reductase